VANKPYIVEWFYRGKWGHQEEFFDISKKYQIPVLNKEKELGYVRDYAVYSQSTYQRGFPLGLPRNHHIQQSGFRGPR
jgi:hypothetical protein